MKNHYQLVIASQNHKVRSFYETTENIEGAKLEVLQILEVLQTLVPASERLVLLNIFTEERRGDKRINNFLSPYLDDTTGEQILFIGENFTDQLFFDQYGHETVRYMCYPGVADFGKYTISVGDKIFFNGDIWAKLLFQVTALNIPNEAACNVEWATQTLRIATDLEWECNTDFTPHEKDGVMQPPSEMEWRALLHNEPKACYLFLTIVHWSIPFKRKNAYRINSKDKMYNYILSVEPAPITVLFKKTLHSL